MLVAGVNLQTSFFSWTMCKKELYKNILWKRKVPAIEVKTE